jgi:hypothetical protein
MGILIVGFRTKIFKLDKIIIFRDSFKRQNEKSIIYIYIVSNHEF